MGKNAIASKNPLNTDFPFPIPNSQFPIPNSQFPIPNSQFPIPNSNPY
ncbi:MAG: hypothetical protein F6K41_00265 [Symploca sp. SIO3E6]|nr:hypothetical protein [Caldora sp. SIO3E6]